MKRTLIFFMCIACSHLFAFSEEDINEYLYRMESAMSCPRYPDSSEGLDRFFKEYHECIASVYLDRTYNSVVFMFGINAGYPGIIGFDDFSQENKKDLLFQIAKKIRKKYGIYENLQRIDLLNKFSIYSFNPYTKEEKINTEEIRKFIGGNSVINVIFISQQSSRVYMGFLLPDGEFYFFDQPMTFDGLMRKLGEKNN